MSLHQQKAEAVYKYKHDEVQKNIFNKFPSSGKTYKNLYKVYFQGGLLSYYYFLGQEGVMWDLPGFRS